VNCVKKIVDATDKIGGGRYSSKTPSRDLGSDLDALLEGMAEGFLAFDANWRLTVFNRAAEDLLGVPRKEAIGKTLREFSPKIAGTDIERRYRGVMSLGATEEFESYLSLRPDRYCEMRAFPYRDGIGVALRDITDRRNAERAAQESEGRLRAIADALPLLISYIDKDQVFRFANKPYETWFGRPLSEIVGRRAKDIMDPAMYEARRPFLDRALAGETVSYEADFPQAAGTVSTEVVHVPHLDDSGRTVGIYSLVQDITARKHAERVLSESEQRFRSIANSAPVPIWVTRMDGLREFVNRAYHEFLGVSLEEALHFDWRKALHPDDLAGILVEQRAGEGSRKPFALEARYRCYDGRWRWLRSESQPRWGPNGDHVGFIGVAHDITTSKEAEQKLTELNEILESRIQQRTQQLAATQALIHSFFQHSSECHAILVEAGDGQFRYEEVNPATLQLYGKAREQVIGYTIEEALGREAATEIGGHLEACLQRGSHYRYERVHGESSIEAVATPVPQEPGSPRRLIVSAHDVTERRRLERQLQQSQKMEAVGQLTGGVAHDFNNLLTLILGGLDIIGRQAPNLPLAAERARIERGREVALQGVKRATAVTKRLLAFSRQQPLAPRPLDANKLVASVAELLRRTLGEAIVLQTLLAEGLWRTFADPNQLENALLNLALNARDAMPEGGRLIIETANATLDRAYVASLSEPCEPGEYVAISVADTGKGMDRATRERAFDPFFTTKEVGKGTGLGLSQVYGFARQSAGHVRIFSEIRKGAMVQIYLPRRLIDETQTFADEVQDISRSGGAETILVVEDDPELREYASDVLQELGYCVLEAENGATALDALDGDHRVDLLLTDVVMPGGMNGRQLADQAVQLRPSLKILYMTGYARDATFPQDSNGGAHIIAKPFSFEDLAARVRERLDGAG
jgi:PAS domain S-box-containing protein